MLSEDLNFHVNFQYRALLEVRPFKNLYNVIDCYAAALNALFWLVK